MLSSETQKVNLGLIQMKMSEDLQQNLDRALEMIAVAAEQKAHIICLPELFRTPYFAQLENAEKDYSEPLFGQTANVLSQIAQKHKVVVIGGSFYENDWSKKYNTSLIFNTDGSLLGKYRKMHIPQDPGFFEKNYFAEGDLGYKVFETPFCKIAVLICYDQWFPEAARAVALAGADIVFYPTAIGSVEEIPQGEGDWHEAWENVQRGHAIANGMVVAAVNRVGREGTTQFWGGSFVCDAFGKTIARASSEEQVVVCEVDLGHAKFIRDSWGFFRNRRPLTYSKLVE